MFLTFSPLPSRFLDDLKLTLYNVRPPVLVFFPPAIFPLSSVLVVHVNSTVNHTPLFRPHLSGSHASDARFPGPAQAPQRYQKFELPPLMARSSAALHPALLPAGAERQKSRTSSQSIRTSSTVGTVFCAIASTGASAPRTRVRVRRVPDYHSHCQSDCSYVHTADTGHSLVSHAKSPHLMDRCPRESSARPLLPRALAVVDSCCERTPPTQRNADTGHPGHTGGCAVGTAL